MLFEVVCHFFVSQKINPSEIDAIGQVKMGPILKGMIFKEHE